MFHTGSILESYDTSVRWLISIRFSIVICAARAFRSKDVPGSAEKFDLPLHALLPVPAGAYSLFLFKQPGKVKSILIAHGKRDDRYGQLRGL